MRIISGIYKGRKLPFSIPDGIRPTTDRNREMIFNILNNIIELEDVIFLDLFAGSGIMSLETLSRRAKKVVMIDKSFKSVNLIKKNFEHLKIEKEKYKLIKGDSLKLINEYSSEVNLVFVDPPYFENIYPKILDTLKVNLSFGTIVIVESPKAIKLDLDGFNLLKTKSMSDSEFHFLKKC